jgi:tetratricopeptide (TPR) repeat protein
VLGSLERRRVAKLWEEGRVHLQQQEFEKALEIARRLESERFSGAFDLAAQALAGLDRLSEAIATLERGVRVAPGAWLNWQLLGNYRSDAGDLEGAATAYRRALECEDVWIDSIRFNQAVVAERSGNVPDALELVEDVGDARLVLQKSDLKARLLLELDDASAAIDECLSATSPDEPTPAQRACSARLCVTHGKALLRLGNDRDGVLRRIAEALGTYPDSDELLVFLRELRAENCSQISRVWSVVVNYALGAAERAEVGALGFYRSGQIAADSSAEAVSLLREIEGTAVLALNEEPEIERVDEPTGPLKGVLSASARYYYVARE